MITLYFKSLIKLVMIGMLISISFSVHLVMAEQLFSEPEEKVIVTANPLGLDEDTNVTNSVLTGDELYRKRSYQIGDTLAHELGISSSFYGPSSARPIIRGLGGSRLRILTDGVGTLDVSALSTDHAVVSNPFQAQQIEILRGPETLLYGGAAIAGVINVVNNRVPKKKKPSSAVFDAQYSSALNGTVVGFMGEGGTDKIALHFDQTIVNQGDYDAANQRVEHTENQAQEMSFGMSAISDSEYIGFAFTRTQRFYELPFNIDEPDSLASIDLNQDRFDISGNLEDPLAGFENLFFSISYSDYAHIELENDVEPATLFSDKQWESRWELNHASIGNLDGVIGLQYRHRDFSAVGDESYIPETAMNSVGVFFLEDTTWHKWHFLFGGRYEYLDNKNKPDQLSVSNDLYSLSIGATYLFSELLEFNITLSHAERGPSLSELFANGPHHASETFEVGSATLNKEVVNDLNISMIWKNDMMDWLLNLFVYQFSDYIYTDFVDINNDGQADRVDEAGGLGGELLSIRYNQEDALFYGIESSMLFPITSQLSSRVFFDWVQGRLDDGGFLPRISAPRLGMSIDYQTYNWHYNLTGTQVFRQGLIAPLETETSGYFLLDFDIDYQLGTKGVSNLYLRLRNLLDEDARLHTSFIKDRVPLPGRSIILGVRMTY